MVGQKAIALGNPFGLDNTLTTGIISALNRKIDGLGGIEIHGIIQTDASINPGNSGGPLLDSKGKLIGMNTAIISQSGTSAGLGFAVPVDTIKRIIPQLIQYGKEIHPTIGIEIESRVDLKNGLLIKTVTSENAKRSGLRGFHRDSLGWLHFGDILLKVDNKEVNTSNELYHALDSYKIGDTIKVTFVRGNKLLTTKVQLSSN
jgi:S1-C subfamily serine protease